MIGKLALAVVTAVAAAAGVTTVTADAAQHACTRHLPVTHAANWVDMDDAQTCGFSYRAWGDWGGVYHYGTYRSANGLHSVACDEPTCQSHPDGKLFKGGYQVKRTGKLVRTFGGGVRTLAAVRRACTTECIYYQGWTGQPGWFQAKWVTNANSYYVRGVAKCGNGTRNTILKLGGWVRSIGLYSRATCTSSYPNLAGAAYDTKHCSTCSFTRTWVTIPGLWPGARLFE